MRGTRVPRLLCAMGIAGTVCVIAATRPASARDAAKWVVTEITGQAKERGEDGAWHSLARGSVVGEGRAVETGPEARLVLIHGKDLITVSPNSAFHIPPASDPAASVSFVQTLGTLLYRIEHLPERRFEVDAPDLVAVVKGTVFTVTAGEAANSVHVAGGAVQVTASLSHDVVLVHPGQIAVVSSAGRDLTILGGAGPGKELQRRSQYSDPADEALGTSTAAASPAGESRHGSEVRGAALTTTVGEEHLDIAKATKGLLGNNGAKNAGGYFSASLNHDQDTSAAGSNPNASGGNPNVGGGNPNAMGGNANAMGGNPNAMGGNPNAKP
jgi:hypothetical protein